MPFGQVATSRLDVGAGGADAVEDGEQDVEVVDEPVPAGRHRPASPVPPSSGARRVRMSSYWSGWRVSQPLMLPS